MSAPAARRSDRKVIAYLSALAVTAVAFAAIVRLFYPTVGSVWALIALSLAAAFAERERVWLVKQSEASISLLPALFAAVLFGPLAAMTVAAFSMMGNFRRPYAKWFNYTCSRAINGGVTGVVAAGVLDAVPPGMTGLTIATVIGAIVIEALDVGFAALTVAIRGTADPRALVRSVVPVLALAVPLYAPVVALLALSYEEVSPLTLPLFVVPALAAQRLYSLYQSQRQLTEDLVSTNARLERASLSFATALVATLDARDRYTAGHSAAVAIYARDIARRMGLTEAEQQLVHVCGLVHDIGKIGLPPGLLEKPGALTLDERRQMQEHSAIGERILANVEDYAEIAQIVRHHHERVDGMGYPDGLSRDEIPILSRIIAVADAYNAMTSDRPYRDAMPTRVARLRLAQGVEGQFDTDVVVAFEAILAGSDEAYRRGTARAFTFDEQDRYLVIAA